MEGFENFVDHIVSSWRKERTVIYEQKGLGSPNNRSMGDSAEREVLKKIQRLKPQYKVLLSKGSQTPADVYALGKRKQFYHLMLVQVKSSIFPNGITHLKGKDLARCKELAKFVKMEYLKYPSFKNIKTKPVLVSIGYVGLSNEVVNDKTESRIVHSFHYKNYVSNFKNVDLDKANSIVRKVHYLLQK